MGATVGTERVGVGTAPVTSRQVAARWLAHPVSLAAIAVMVVNDHVLKAEFGTWWTGKLSDVAGLVFFPALLAFGIALVSPRSRPQTVALSSLVVTLFGFTIVKVTAGGAAAASAVLSGIVGPSIVLRDPTDLIALASLPFAAWIATRSRSEEKAPRLARWRVAMVAPVALLASVATSPAPQPNAVALEEREGMWILEVAEARPYEDTVWAVWTEDGWVTWAEANGITESPRTVEEIESMDEPEALEPTTTSCIDGSDGLCARAVPERLAVEISRDSGTTWRTDWKASAAGVAAMVEEYGPGDLTTSSVAVIRTSEGPIVIAANGRDGLAIRDADGAWERVGFEGVPGVVGHSLAPVPELLNPNPSYPVPPAVAWSWLGAALSLAIVGGLASWVHYQRAYRLVVSAPVLAVSAAAAYSAAAENHHVAMTQGPVPILGWLLPLMLCAGSLVAGGLAALPLGGYRRTVAGPVWGGAITGLITAGITGAVISLTSTPFSLQVAIVSTAALAGSVPWVAVMLARRHKRAKLIPATPPVQPLSGGPGAITGP